MLEMYVHIIRVLIAKITLSCFFVLGTNFRAYFFFKKKLNASRPSEYPPVRGENVKTFRWDHRLQIQINLFVTFERVPRW